MATKTNKCACGCGKKCRKTFLPGHDMKLRSKLIERGVRRAHTLKGAALVRHA